MTLASNLFQQLRHNDDIDEKFHQFRFDNISNVFFWQLIFSDLHKNCIQYDDIIECGVGRGRSLITLASLSKLFHVSYDFPVCFPKIWGFDSFQGFPSPTYKDISNVRSKPLKGEWSSSPSNKYQYTQEFLLQVLESAGVDTSSIELIEGYFSSTCQLVANTNHLQIGILHCDGDLYSSVKDTLNAFHESVVQGGFIVFDDFKLSGSLESDHFPGARLAYEEFLLQSGDQYEVFANPRDCPVLKKISMK